MAPMIVVLGACAHLKPAAHHCKNNERMEHLLNKQRRVTATQKTRLAYMKIFYAALFFPFLLHQADCNDFYLSNLALTVNTVRWMLWAIFHCSPAATIMNLRDKYAACLFEGSAQGRRSAEQQL